METIEKDLLRGGQFLVKETKCDEGTTRTVEIGGAIELLFERC